MMVAERGPALPRDLPDDRLGTMAVALAVAELRWIPDVTPAVMDRISRDVVAYPEHFDRRPVATSGTPLPVASGRSAGRTIGRLAVFAILLVVIAGLFFFVATANATATSVCLPNAAFGVTLDGCPGFAYDSADMFDPYGDFKLQLPDSDPEETLDWIASLDALYRDVGRGRAQFVLYKLLKRARQLHIGLPPLTQTRYINTISPEQEPPFPGDEEMEKRIRRLVRWNAAAMVLRANKASPGIGGHLATFASATSLYEVGLNHFFRGKDAEGMGDQVYYQGHAAPGMYARAFLEGRLSESQLDHFRREVVPGEGLSSYPHPRLMPDFWEFPTVSMGLSPLAAIYQARFNRYLHNRGIKDTSNSRVWAFLGDGETDEPESLGALSIAGREGLDNLVFVVNCNLQRLDGPVRGNGKIVQELEAVFRGAGWNVIKVIWGREWDELLARDPDGVLVSRMAEVVDGEWQKYSVEPGSYMREHFFGTDPRLGGAGGRQDRRRAQGPASWWP